MRYPFFFFRSCLPAAQQFLGAPKTYVTNSDEKKTHLSRLACPEALTSGASAGLDAVASDSRECYRRAYPVADDHRASAADLVVAAEPFGEHPWYSGGALLPDGGGEAAEVALVAGCAVAEAVDGRQ